jgi:hypothetical protein
LRVYNPPFDVGPRQEIDGWGINASLTSCDWLAFADLPELMKVRFIAAFPEQNMWAVYGASRRLTVRSENARATHAWFDVGKTGLLREVAAPAEGNGYACSQLLTTLCVWPNADGILHCLAENPSRWRPVYLRYSELAAQVGEGTISEQEYYWRVRQDAELHHIAPLHLDLEYARFLARMKAEGGLEAIGPMTTDQKQAREARAHRIVRELNSMTLPAPSTAQPYEFG